jgi:hypothetical protein
MLDDDFFASLNRPLTEEQKQAIAEKVAAMLENRVGDKLADQVSDEKFTEFENVVENGDDAAVDEWLAANAPGYDQLVMQTLDQLKQEVATNPDSFMSSP